MKYLLLLFFSSLFQILNSQILKDITISQSIDEFKIVKDSVLKFANQTNSIVLKRCEDFSELHLINDSSGWKGFFIENLSMDGLYIPDIEFIDDKGIKRILKTKKTKLIKFEADSLYKLLIDKNIYRIFQLTEDSIQKIYNQQKSKDLKVKKGTTIFYSLPNCSHSCSMTVEITENSKNIRTSYSSCLIYGEELNFIREIKSFKDIFELLDKTLKECEK